MSALSKIGFSSFGTRRRLARIASGAAAVIAMSLPLTAGAAWELRFANDGTSTLTATFVWTFDNHEFQTSDVQTVANSDKAIVYTPANGKVSIGGDVVIRFPNDFHMHTVATNHDVTDFNGKVPFQGSPDDIGGVLDKFPGRPAFLLPIPSQLHEGDPEIFSGVDLSAYLEHPLDTIPSFLSFVDGVSPDLPGYVVGLSPVTVDPVTGNYVTSDPFSGDVAFGSVMTLAAIPEPPSWMLLAIGLTALGGWRRRQRGSNPGSNA